MSEYTFIAKIVVVLLWLSAFGAAVFVNQKIKGASDRIACTAMAFVGAPVVVLLVCAVLGLFWHVLEGSWYVLTH